MFSFKDTLKLYKNNDDSIVGVVRSHPNQERSVSTSLDSQTFQSINKIVYFNGRKYPMFTRFSPITVLNPTAVFIIYVALVVTVYEEHGTFVIAVGTALCGLYLGSAWRGAHELWMRQVWKFHKPEGWISEKARLAYSERHKLFGYWLFRCVLKVIFFASVLVFGGLFYYVMMKLLNSRVSLWLAIPAMAILGPLVGSLPMVPYMLYKKWASDESNFIGRIEAQLKHQGDLSSEIEKLKAWDEAQQRLIMAGKASIEMT